MKFFRAFNIFLFLLEANEWYIIADNKYRHIKDANMKFGKFIQTTKTDADVFIQQEMLINEANDILTRNFNN